MRQQCNFVFKYLYRVIIAKAKKKKILDNRFHDIMNSQCIKFWKYNSKMPDAL